MRALWDVISKNDLYEIIKVLGVIFVGGTLWLNYRNNQKEFDWRKKRFTVDLFLQSSQPHAQADVVLLAEAFPQLLTPRPGAGPSEDDSARILDAVPGRTVHLSGRGHDGFKLRRAIMEQFNSIEPIALAYNYGLIDIDAIDKAVGAVILRRYDFFADFIAATEKIRGDHPWPSIPTLVRHLKRRRGLPG